MSSYSNASSAGAVLLEWSPQYAVDVPEIDREHRSLFDAINRLHGAMLEGQSAPILRRLLGELNEYAVNHFAHEEALMKASGYPGIEAHIQQHDALHRRARVLLERYERGELTMSIELTLFLAEWLRKHTMTVDVRLAEYLRERGAAGHPG